MILQTSATAAGKTTINLTSPNSKPATSKWYYVTAATADALTAVTAGTAITTSAWTEMTSASVEITPTSGHKFVRVVEVKASDSKPLGFGDAHLNIG